MKYLVAILPGVLIFILIKSLDRYGKKPMSLLIKLFMAGALTTLFAMFLEQVVFVAMLATGFNSVVFIAFIGIALSEEGAKLLAVLWISLIRSSRDEARDGIIYSVMVALGFATVENILFVHSSDIGTALARAVTAVPVHALIGIVMGYMVSMSKTADGKKKSWRLLSLAVPVALHGLYDTIVFLSAVSAFAPLLLVPLMIAMCVAAVKLVRKTFAPQPAEDSSGHLTDQGSDSPPLSESHVPEDEEYRA